MSIFPLRCLAGALLISVASIADSATPLLATDPSELARTVLGPLPGTAVVGVLQGDHASLGAAGAQAGQSAQLLFEIGSISKVFTGLLLAQAVERGELKLDTTLGSLKLTKTPLPPRTASITLGQLVTHTSCLPTDPNDIAGDMSMAETLEHYPRTRLWSALAAQQLNHDGACTAQYSNFGFAMLGESLATRYHTTWEQLVYERITKPLGMRDTAGHIGDKAGRLAAAYGNGKPVAPLLEWGAFAGAGGLHSSPQDMLTFSRALLAGRRGPLGAAAERVLQPLYGKQIAYAIEMRGPATQRTFSKDGRTPGFSSYWTILPDTHEALIVLASNARENGQVTRVIMRQLGVETPAGRTSQAPPSVARLATATQQDYGGHYRCVAPDENIGYTVQAQGGQLEIRADGERKQVVFPQERQADTFLSDIAPVSYRFERDATGAVSSLIVQRDDRRVRALRGIR